MNIFELILGFATLAIAGLILFPISVKLRDKITLSGIVLCAGVVLVHGFGFEFKYCELILAGILILGLVTIIFGYLSPWEQIAKENKDNPAKVGAKAEAKDAAEDIGAHSFLQQK